MAILEPELRKKIVIIVLYKPKTNVKSQTMLCDHKRWFSGQICLDPSFSYAH